MGSEIALQDPEKVSFHSYQLTVKTKSIFCALRDNNRNSLKIAGLLGHIHDTNLFIDDFDSFETYAAQVFGIKKAQAYNLVTVGNRWILHDEKGNPLAESILPHSQNCDWGVTKLLAFSRCGIDPETAISLVNNGVVSIDMSVSKLTAAIKEWKESIEALQAPDETEETEEVEDTEPDETPSESNETPNGDNSFTDEVISIRNSIKAITKRGIDEHGTPQNTEGFQAACVLARESLYFMNNLYYGESTRFFSFQDMCHTLEIISGVLYAQGFLDKKANTENGQAWASAMQSIRAGLTAFETLYTGFKNDNQ